MKNALTKNLQTKKKWYLRVESLENIYTCNFFFDILHLPIILLYRLIFHQSNLPWLFPDFYSHLHPIFIVLRSLFCSTLRSKGMSTKSVGFSGLNLGFPKLISVGFGKRLVSYFSLHTLL